MGKSIRLRTKVENKGSYDVIVAGGGVAGVAAALTAKKRGKSVLLIEKSNILGGLATLGLVNYFVPMCNGRGKQIIFGLADEWFRESVKFGYDSIPSKWRDGEPEEPTEVRMVTHYSPYIFAFQLTEMIKNAGVDLLYDCIVSEPVMKGKVCKGVVTESKSGKEYYEAKIVIDTTGDGDILRRAGVPVVLGKNYYTYLGKSVTLDTCKKAVEEQDIRFAFGTVTGGGVSLYGTHQPADKPLWSGTTVNEVTEYLVDNQLEMFKNIKKTDRKTREIAMIPLMPNFRTTCHIDGDYTLLESDKYKHFPDSVCAINDFDKRDFLYEVPFRCLVRKEFPNLITAGRTASADGYGWDILRVISPAILTGQAAAEAAVLAIDTEKPIAKVDIDVLQQKLQNDDNIMVHFPDELVPSDKETIYMANDGHI